MLLANLSLTARRSVSHRLAIIFFALIVGVPIAWALFAVAGQALDSAALHALWQQPQARSALALSVWTALVSGVLAWLTAARLLAIGFVHQTLMRWMQHLPALLATPHAAMAIALVLWLSPSGWLLRLVSPTLTGFQSPPDWSTTQDPWGLGLILALWLKEVPFLLWIGATQLRRDDIRRRWQSEYGLAQTLGYPPSAAFARVVWPQLALTLRWPLLAVVAYGLGVVDMALILGPTTPPTFAVLSWQWLGDANVAQQAMGAVAAGVLTGCVALMAALIMYGRATRWLLVRGTMAVVQWPPLTTPVSLATSAHGVPPRWTVRAKRYAHSYGLWAALLVAYLLSWFALAVGSVSGLWPFPHVWRPYGTPSRLRSHRPHFVWRGAWRGLSWRHAHGTPRYVRGCCYRWYCPLLCGSSACIASPCLFV
jgi:putative thiamine transport system permease protein